MRCRDRRRAPLVLSWGGLMVSSRPPGYMFNVACSYRYNTEAHCFAFCLFLSEFMYAVGVQIGC